MATAAGTTTTHALARFARSVAVWGVLGVSAHGSAHAEPPSVASIEELMAINGAREAQESAVGDIASQVRSQVVMSLLQQNCGKPLTAQQQGVVDKAVPDIGVVVHQELDWPRMKDTYIQLYQEHLSQADVDLLTLLHQKTSYVALMQKMLLINQQSALLVSQQMPVITQRIPPVLEDAMKRALESKP